MSQHKSSNSPRQLVYVANVRLPSPKAHSIQIMKMCEAFSESGFQVTLIIPRRFLLHQPICTKNLYKFYVVKPNFNIKHLPCIDLLFIDQLGIHLSILPYLVQDFTFSLSALWYTRSSTLIYTRSKLFSFLKGLFHRPVFFESHHLPSNNHYHRFLASHTRGIIGITQHIVKIWQTYQAQVLYAPDAVSAEFFHKISTTSSRQTLGLPRNKLLIGYIGRLETMGIEKGIDAVVKAARLLKSTPNRHLFIIVGGPFALVKQYQHLVNHYQLQENFLFTGHVPFSQVPLYLRAMDILLIPFPRTLHLAYSASPLKLFEYMAAGRPIIATDLPSLREILTPKQAIFIKPNRPKQMAAAISTLAESKELRHKLGTNAFHLAGNYTYAKRGKLISSFISVL